MKNKDRKS